MAGDDTARAIDAALDAARKAVRMVRAVPGHQDRFMDAGRLSAGLREVSDEAQQMRQEAVAAIHEEGALALAPLADRVGMSKMRADQLRAKQDKD